MNEPDQTTLMEVAEMLLNDEGQVEVSVLIDEGEKYRAQVYLLGAMDKLMCAGTLSAAELTEIVLKIGLSQRDIERIRGSNADKFVR